MDLGHNFVLAHDSCNSAKGMMLAAGHLASWAERNARHGDQLGEACVRGQRRGGPERLGPDRAMGIHTGIRDTRADLAAEEVYAPLTADWQRVLVA